MSTPHINAKLGEFAETVIMSGDPLRIKYIADNFLNEVIKVNKIRNMLGYTGKYKGMRISVMSHGIGIPSCSIYVKELVEKFNVKKIIRLGSCAAINESLNIKDIVVGLSASTDSKVNRIRFNNYDFSTVADFNLLQNFINAAKIANVAIHIGNLFSTDLFYHSDKNLLKLLNKYGFLGIEMEAAGIYFLAAELKISALTICTVSDHLYKNEFLSANSRQNTFNKMIKTALESLLL